MKKIELLSPAGDLEKLKIAFAYGADAVYAGVSHFSLRIRAGKEFTYESFQEGVEYAHARGKKVYATINGFPFNSQIELYRTHIKKMADIKPDAFIVSTVGVIALVKEIAPQIDIHLSTQANVMNYMDAKFFYDLGVKRIITAREMSLRDVIDVKRHLPQLELEVFVHGSMCFAYSGRCLISSLQKGRVPNRGSCANDCRFEYTLYAKAQESDELLELKEVEGEGTYIMNSKDLNLVGYVDEIIESGAVDSIKIEGRTKSPYYVGATTKAYRMAIDDYYAGEFDSAKYQRELESTKQRGFTDAYLVHRPFQKHDTQNLITSISEGTHQVCAEVSEQGDTALCKFKMCIGEEIEILNSNNQLEPIDNEIGTIYQKDAQWFIRFKKITGINDKAYECIHSGNTNPIVLPATLPAYTFLRKKL